MSDMARALALLAHSFPGTRVLAPTELTRAGLNPCRICGELCARVDARGPVHDRCVNKP